MAIFTTSKSTQAVSPRRKRHGLALGLASLAAAGASVVPGAPSAEATFGRVYKEQTTTQQCRGTWGWTVWETGSRGGSRWDQPWYIASYADDDYTNAGGVRHITTDVTYYNSWSKQAKCVPTGVADIGRVSLRWVAGGATYSCYHEFWQRGYFVTSRWVSGRC